MEKEHWINEVLESTNGIKLVLPDAQLFAKIQQNDQILKTDFQFHV